MRNTVNAADEAANTAHIQRGLLLQVNAHIARKQAWLAEQAKASALISAAIAAGDFDTADRLTELHAVRHTTECAAIYREAMAIHRALSPAVVAGLSRIDLAGGDR